MRYDRKFLFGLLVLGFLLFCMWTAPQIAAAEIPEDVLEAAKDATVLITVKKADGNIGSGSGFFVKPNKIVTNIHVVAGATIVSVVVQKEKYYNIEKIIGFDPRHDLVILQASVRGQPLKLSEGQMGEPIFAVGYPSVAFNATQGTIYDIWNEGKQLHLISNSEDSRLSPLTSGNSGGPVLNLKGEVVGVAVTGEKVGSNTPAFGGAVSTLVLKELIDKSKSLEPMSLSDWQEEPCVRAYVFDNQGEYKVATAESKEETADQKRLYREAIEYFDKASKLCPNYAATHFRLGKAKLSLDKFIEAKNAFTKVTKLIPDHAKAYFYIGMAQYELGKVNKGEDAEEHYKKAISAFDKTITLMKEDNADYQDRAAADKNVAKLVFQSKSARYYLRAAAKFDLGDLKANQGDKKIAQSLYSQILDDLTEAIKLNPDGADAFKLEGTAYGYYIQGGVKLILGQSEASQRNVEKALEHYGEAFKAYKEAAKLSSDDAEAYFYYTKAIDLLNPISAETYLIRGGINVKLGEFKTDQEVSVARKHYKAAIEDFKETIELNPNNAHAYSNLGYTKYLLGKSFESEGGQENMERARKLYEKAKAYSNKAIQRDLKLPYSYHTRGLARSALGNYKAAIEAFDNAIEFKDNYVEADEAAEPYYARGLAKQALGQHEAAKADFEEAKKLDPNVGEK